MPWAALGGLATVAAVALSPGRAVAGSLGYPLGCGAGPSDFRVTTFASGLNFPYGMQQLPDGSLLVATSKPNAVNGSYFASTGELLRFEDKDQDGVADGPPTLIYSGLPGALTGLRSAGPWVFVTSAMSGSERITVLRTGPTPGNPLTLFGSINLAFPFGWRHKSYALALRPTPDLAEAHDLFFNVGSKENNTATTEQVLASGLLSALLNADRTATPSGLRPLDDCRVPRESLDARLGSAEGESVSSGPACRRAMAAGPTRPRQR